jgi:hypothetical protein
MGETTGRPCPVEDGDARKTFTAVPLDLANPISDAGSPAKASREKDRAKRPSKAPIKQDEKQHRRRSKTGKASRKHVKRTDPGEIALKSRLNYEYAGEAYYSMLLFNIGMYIGCDGSIKPPTDRRGLELADAIQQETACRNRLFDLAFPGSVPSAQ